jgi:putative hemolysin
MALTVKLAQNEEERQRAYALRHQVFIEEKAYLQGGQAAKKSGPERIEVDEFDPYCEHLIVKDEDTQEVVGTYRLLDGNNAEKIGFYSERFYNLSPFAPWRRQTIELGRSCVRADFRGGRVIAMLWQAIGRLIHEREIKFLIGLPSLYVQTLAETGEIYAFLRNYYRSETVWVEPKDGFRIAGLAEAELAENEQDMFRKLPPLLKGYIRSGAKIAGTPAYDPNFGSTLFFTVMESSQITERYRRNFVIK